MKTEITITALVCPRCGAGLDGLRWDCLFTCAPCGLALFVEHGRTRLFPCTRARVDEGAPIGAGMLWLPFWELATEVGVVEPPGSAPSLAGAAAALDRVWVAGFAVRRPELFGEPGFLLTEQRARLEPAGEGGAPARMWGACRGPELVTLYARLTVMRLLDRRADVTGVEIDVRVTRADLWAVPFDDRGDRLVDLATGASLPAAAFEDLAEIRAAAERRPG